ncbi:hypothetical protein [Marinilabilia sp.]
MKRIILVILLLGAVWEMKAQSRISITGGYELGLMNTGRVGTGYKQNMKSTRYVADFAYRYNGANHFVIEGGYRYDSCAFVNNVEYLMPDASAFDRYHTNSMIKMKSAMLGVAYRLALNGENMGVSLQSGVSGQYIFEASRYHLPDEDFEYRLYDEINPLNLLWRTKIGVRYNVFFVLVGYESPFFDTLNHDEILKTLPGDEANRSDDMRGMRLDADAFFVSFGMRLTLGKVYKAFNKAVAEHN